MVNFSQAIASITACLTFFKLIFSINIQGGSKQIQFVNFKALELIFEVLPI